MVCDDSINKEPDTIRKLDTSKDNVTELSRKKIM